MNSLLSDDGIALNLRQWLPEMELRSTLVMVHGFGDFSAAYDPLGRFFAERGHTVWAFDLRGHGLSPGARGHLSSWATLRADLAALLRMIGKPAVPLFLLGMSMGAVIVADYVLHHREGIGGAIFAAAPFGRPAASPLAIATAKFIARFLPRLPVPLGLDLNNISRDREAAQAYLNHPQFHQRATALAISEFFRIWQELQHRSGEITLPSLLVHGGADRIAPLDRQYDTFFEKLGARDKTRKTYPGAYHNLLIETNRQEVFLDAAQWIEARLAHI